MAARTTRSPSPVLHSAAGFTIASDRELPGFTAADSNLFPDIHVHTTAPPAWSGDGVVIYTGHMVESGRPAVVIHRGRDGYSFVYADGTRFWVNTAGTDIWCSWTTTIEDACTYFAGSVLGLAVRARGELALHASAVVVGGRALLLTGPHGSGKSTTAAAFGTRRFDILADDVVRMAKSTSGWLAHPFTSMLRLWPDAEQHVLGSDTLPRITESWDKRALYPGMRGVSWANSPAVVAAVIALAGPGGIEDDPVVASLSAPAAFLALSANSSASHAIGPDLRAREFDQIASFVREVRCGRIETAPRARPLDATVDAILAWLT